MASVFIKVPVSDRLPSYYGLYDTNEGVLEYSTDGGWLYPQPTPEYWFEEIELPEEEAARQFANEMAGDGYYNMSEIDAFVDGFNYLYEDLKGGQS